jgi:trehalose 6-phosphate synthase
VVVTGRGRLQTISAQKREVRVGAFPISIDSADFAERAASPEVRDRASRIREDLEGRKMFLGVDRLDYTKGIPMRLRAFRRMLRENPSLCQHVRFVQVVVPSRETIPSYQRLKEEIEQLVGDINGEFTRDGWVPLHYIFRSFERDELLAYYRLADVAVVTPLNDGMNLVAKEYCACNVDEQGVLILSEFAGAAAELGRGAMLVNPYDIVGMAGSMKVALSMPLKERKSRMSRLRRQVKLSDIHRWVSRFLDSADDSLPASGNSKSTDDSARPFRALSRRARATDYVYTSPSARMGAHPVSSAGDTKRLQ